MRSVKAALQCGETLKKLALLLKKTFYIVQHVIEFFNLLTGVKTILLAGETSAKQVLATAYVWPKNHALCVRETFHESF